ncbi:MAG: hypothetical protein ABIH39_09040 [Candidatus Margulisiibacteriota bacterium]
MVQFNPSQWADQFSKLPDKDSKAGNLSGLMRQDPKKLAAVVKELLKTDGGREALKAGMKALDCENNFIKLVKEGNNTDETINKITAEIKDETYNYGVLEIGKAKQQAMIANQISIEEASYDTPQKFITRGEYKAGQQDQKVAEGNKPQGKTKSDLAAEAKEAENISAKLANHRKLEAKIPAAVEAAIKDAASIEIRVLSAKYPSLGDTATITTAKGKVYELIKNPKDSSFDEIRTNDNSFTYAKDESNRSAVSDLFTAAKTKYAEQTTKTAENTTKSAPPKDYTIDDTGRSYWEVTDKNGKSIISGNKAAIWSWMSSKGLNSDSVNWLSQQQE